MVFEDERGQPTPAMFVWEMICTFASIAVLQLFNPYAAESSDRVQTVARWTIAVQSLYAMILYFNKEAPGTFGAIALITLFLVPSLVLFQLLYEFLFVPIRAQMEHAPEIKITSLRFWRLFFLEGGCKCRYTVNATATRMQFPLTLFFALMNYNRRWLSRQGCHSHGPICKASD